jgi:maltose operon protein
MSLKLDSMKKAPLIMLLLGGVLVASCAANKLLDTARHELETATVCCAGYEQFDFKPLEFRETDRIIINRESPVFQFDTGKSYFKAFRLPATEKSYSIIVGSDFAEQVTRSGTSFVFSPVVMFLDADYRVTRKVDKGFAAVVPSGNSMNNAKLEARIAMGPRAADERYMVIYTTTALLNRTTTLRVYKYARWGTIEDNYAVPNAPTGELNISLEPERS